MRRAMTETADVVVIGGGIVGRSAAYHLAAAGAGRVLLLEREAGVGRGATGACAGGFRLRVHQRDQHPAPRSRACRSILGFEPGARDPVDVTQDGYLFLVRDPATWRAFERGIELQRSLGVSVEVLDAAGVARLVPWNSRAGRPGGRHVRPGGRDRRSGGADPGLRRRWRGRPVPR